MTAPLCRDGDCCTLQHDHQEHLQPPDVNYFSPFMLMLYLIASWSILKMLER